MNETSNIKDRVKTFNDALNELGKDHPLVIQYHCWIKNGPNYGSMEMYCSEKDLLIFLKLRIITAALNEGWEPQFTENEDRYNPYFFFYTQKEIDEMDEKERANVFILDKPIGKYAGAESIASNYVPSFANSPVCSRLCFKTYELAKYAGKQFIDIYADFLLK